MRCFPNKNSSPPSPLSPPPLSSSSSTPSPPPSPSTLQCCRHSTSCCYISPLLPKPSSAQHRRVFVATATTFCLPNSASKVKFMLKVMAAFACCLYIALVLCQNVHGYQSVHKATPAEMEALAAIRHINGVVLTTAGAHYRLPNPNRLSNDDDDDDDDDATRTQRRNLKKGGHHGDAATGTPKPPTTTLGDIFISVKTTKKNHDNRLELILNTWHQMAKQQTWFFTDEDDKVYQDRTNGHMINTNCSNGHVRRDLCCKMSTEFDMFIESRKKWFCHFDDDNYVNVPRLVSLLNEYSPAMEWYLGKPSVASPLEIHLEYKKRKMSDPKVRFWFATGGAGFCISRALALRMMPVAGGGKLISIGDRIRFPDDVTVGFIIEHLLKVPLTVVDQFHSHLEPMEFIGPETFRDQVSFSYGRIANVWNVINLDGYKSKTEDPTRFHSLHCHLFSYLRTCSR